MIFTPRVLYTVELPIRFGEFDLTDQLKQDARTLGNAAQHILRMMFSNLHELPGGRETPGDLLETHIDGRRVWEVKTTKNGSVNIQPSREKGSGRGHDPERYAKYLNSIAGIIAVDQRELPVVRFCGVLVPDIQALRNHDTPRSFPTNFLANYGTPA